MSSEFTPIVEFARAIADGTAEGTVQAATDYVTSFLDQLAVFDEINSRWRPPRLPIVD